MGFIRGLDWPHDQAEVGDWLVGVVPRRSPQVRNLEAEIGRIHVTSKMSELLHCMDNDRQKTEEI
jgi:hypothetical protein